MIKIKEKRYPYCKFTITQEKQIIDKYIQGKSLREIGKEYDCDPTTVRNILKAYKVETRNYSQARRNFLSYSINENSFAYDNKNTAYWLGVMYSDGYISKTGKYTNYFGLTINEKDLEWLEQFKHFLQYNGKIIRFTSNTTFKKGTKVARLLIGNNKIVSDLEKWGVIEKKTFKLKELPSTSFLDDFIRGYIDGDGSLNKKYPNIIICGTKDLLLSIANYFKIPYSIYSDKSIFALHYNTKESTYLEKRLYKNAEYALQRKFLIAKRSFDSPITLEDVMKNSEYQGKPLEP